MIRKLYSLFASKKSGSTPPQKVEGHEATTSEDQERDSAQDHSLITVYDAYGSELRITREDWRTKMLIPNMEGTWDDPGELYNFILNALNDKFFEDVDGASQRLLEIDDNPERSHTIRGIVLLNLNHLQEAKSVLHEGIEKVGRTGVLLTNLAKVHSSAGDDAKADEILWEAVQTDPNQDNGLLWWLTIANERHGKEGYLAALKTAASLQGSWRPQLWLARHELESGNRQAAQQLYQSILDQKSYTGDGLMMMSGDLGNHGHADLIVELIAPIYDIDQHGHPTGFNLLEAYLRAERVEDGEALLDRFYKSEISPIKTSLDRYAAAFDQVRKRKIERDEIENPEELNFQTIALDQPIWMYGLKNPKWLFNQKSENAPCITFASLHKTGSETGNAERQREDDIGRFSRAIPLYLAEAVYQWTSFNTRMLVPTVDGHSPVVSGGELDGAGWSSQLAEETEYLIIGTIDNTDTNWRIHVEIWHCRTGQCMETFATESALDGLGQTVLDLEKQVLSWIKNVNRDSFDFFYTRPTQDAMGVYLSGLGQSLMLSLLSSNPEGTAEVWGERSMLEWPLNMALRWPKSEVYPLMFLSGLGKAFSYKSDVLEEYRRRTEDLLREAKNEKRLLARLESLVWMLFDPQQLRQYHDQIGAVAHANKEFKEWVTKLSKSLDRE